MNLLASDSNDSPANARNQTTADGHASIEAPSPPNKEGYTPYSVPWYRQGKWRIAMLVGAIVIIGAVVGGVVGGTVGRKNSNLSNGPSVSVTRTPVTVSVSSTSDGAVQATGPFGPTSTPLPPTTTGGAAAHSGGLIAS